MYRSAGIPLDFLRWLGAKGWHEITSLEPIRFHLGCALNRKAERSPSDDNTVSIETPRTRGTPLPLRPVGSSETYEMQVLV